MLIIPAIAKCDWCHIEDKCNVHSNNSGALSIHDMPSKWVHFTHTSHEAGNTFTIENCLFCSFICKKSYETKKKLRELLR